MDKKPNIVTVRDLIWAMAIVIVAAILTAIAVSQAGAQTFHYFSNVTISNPTLSSVTSRVAFPVNAITLISGGYIKSDASDTDLYSGGSATQLMATNMATNLASSTLSNWFTGIITLPAQSNNTYVLNMGDSTYTRDQKLTSMSTDVVSIAHHANLNITTAFTLSADTYLYALPTATSYFFHKPTQYGLYVNTASYVFDVGGTSNLLTFTEVDAASKLSVSTFTASATAVDRDEDVLLYKDFGPGHFNELNINFEIYQGSSSSDNSIGGMALSNTISSVSGFAATDFSVLFIQTAGPVNTIYLRRGAGVADDTYVAASNTPYYVTLVRAINNDTVQLQIYTDSARTVLVDTLSVAGFGTASWRYGYGFTSYNSAVPGLDFYGYVRDVGFGNTVSSALTLNAWTNIRATYTNASIGLTVNNVQVATSPFNGVITTSTYSTSYWNFTGLMDNLRVGDTSVASPTWRLAYNFEPNQISSNTINDLSITNLPASITWAGNPASVTVTIGSLTPLIVASSTITAVGSAGIVTTIAYVNPGVENEPTGPAWPGSEVFKTIWDNTGIPIQTPYILLFAILATIAGFLAWKYFQSLTSMAFASGIVVLTGSYIGIWDWLFTYIWAVLILGGIALEAQRSGGT